jgi:hypothetical protein
MASLKLGIRTGGYTVATPGQIQAIRDLLGITSGGTPSSTESLGTYLPKAQFGGWNINPPVNGTVSNSGPNAPRVDSSSYDFEGGDLYGTGFRNYQTVYTAGQSNLWFNGPEFPGYNFINMQMVIIPTEGLIGSSLMIYDNNGSGYRLRGERDGGTGVETLGFYLFIDETEYLVSRSDPIVRDEGNLVDPVTLAVQAYNGSIYFQCGSTGIYSNPYRPTYAYPKYIGVPHPKMRAVNVVKIQSQNGEAIRYARIDGLD